MIAMREGKVLHEGHAGGNHDTNGAGRGFFPEKACISKDPWTGRPTCVTYEIS